MDVVQPREFGYHIGDKFRRLITLTLNKPYVLDETSLPKPGKMIPWLNIEAPKVEVNEGQQTRTYRIALSYQITNIDKDALDIGVEGHEISIKNGQEKLTLLIQPVRIQAGTIVDSKASLNAGDLQANAAPLAINLTSNRVLAFASMLIACIVTFLLTTFGSPFSIEQPVFTRAYRKLSKLPAESWSAEQYDEALKETHQAFNETAGRVVFTEDVSAFINKNPAFKNSSQQISRFFKHSNDFYFSGLETTQQAFPPGELIKLIKQCSAHEKGAA